ncbi:hypothetical protein D0T25_28025 [Duganella sp. BJB488]|uniref:glycosyltransferase family 2 protein n=1 Tax=unclassified Duganella TaxID=2636909 RepID=UPI000E357926|nr:MULTISPECIES: glycosyltransferase family 2 protein [unclassified Duganella]RFP10447.1 hypothetical protein D0T26_27000 [Duganella sp. BJB489]RFP14294.1 hypothetical protein D0T25_28025 [Duganella sp. BJB488]RFP30230.1 hypothetical protein D0T24_28720 [Duganella sp. BJB480]
MTGLIYPVKNLSFTKTDIVLISVARNEMCRLPSFFEHYRRLGVDKFIIIDNASTDGTSEYLAAQPDTLHFLAPGSYGRANCGHDWIREVLSHCLGNWCVVADCDEFFIYPDHEKCDLKDFAKILKKNNETAVCSYLLDMYSKNAFVSNFLESAQNPLEVCRFYDPIQDRKSLGPDSLCGIFPFDRKGGMRQRIFNVEPCLNKISFFENIKGINLFQGAHFIDGATLSKIRCVTLHFKYLQDFQQYTLDESKREEHFNNASEYKAYSQQLENIPRLSAHYSSSREFVSFNDFFNHEIRSTQECRLNIQVLPSLDQEQVTSASILFSSIAGSDEISTFDTSDEQVIRTVLESIRGPNKSVVILASEKKRTLWIDVARSLDCEVCVIDISSDASIAKARNSNQLRHIENPIVIIEAVAKWHGRLQLIDLLVLELAQHCNASTKYLVDVTDVAVYHHLDHASSRVHCFFGRIPTVLKSSNQSHFISWLARSGVEHHLTQENNHNYALQTASLQFYERLSLRTALFANIIRATLLEWNCELIEMFKIVNSLIAFRPVNNLEEYECVALGLETCVGHPGVVIVYNNFESEANLLLWLSRIAQALDVTSPNFSCAKRVLLNVI